MSSSHEAHEANIQAIWEIFHGRSPEDRDERERLLRLMIGIHAGALTPVSEDEKRGMERVLAILDRKLAEGGAIVGGREPYDAHVENHNRFYRGRRSAFVEVAMMLRSALATERTCA